MGLKVSCDLAMSQALKDDSFSEHQLFDDLIETDLAMHANLDGIMDKKKGKCKNLQVTQRKGGEPSSKCQHS